MNLVGFRGLGGAFCTSDKPLNPMFSDVLFGADAGEDGESGLENLALLIFA